MGYRFRRVSTDDDRKIVAKIHRQTFNEEAPKLIGGAWGDPKLEGAMWWILWDENEEPAGFCGVWPPAFAGRPCYLIRAGVLPAHRGQGLQKRMIAIRLKYAKQQGWKSAVTYTLVDNAPSSNSLITAGFRVYDPAYKWNGRGIIYWRYEL